MRIATRDLEHECLRSDMTRQKRLNRSIAAASSFEQIPNVSANSRASSTGISIARRRGDNVLFVYFSGAR
jgi:hypothetical protein